MLLQQVDDRLLPVSVVPSSNKLVQRAELGRDRFACVLPIALGNGFPVAADILDTFGNDARGDTRDDNFGRPTVVVVVLVIIFFWLFRIGRDRIIIVIGLVNNDGRAIKSIVTEKL